MRNSRALSLAVAILLAAAGAAAQVWRGPAALGVEARSRKGQPIPGAEVLLTYQGVRGSGGPVAVATAAKGRVVVGGLIEGEWQIEISHPDYLSYVAVLVVRRGRKPTIGASFLQAGGRSLEPMRVNFFKAEGGSAPPARVAETVDAPVATPTAPRIAEQEPTVATEPADVANGTPASAVPADTPAEAAAVEPDQAAAMAAEAAEKAAAAERAAMAAAEQTAKADAAAAMAAEQAAKADETAAIATAEQAAQAEKAAEMAAAERAAKAEEAAELAAAEQAAKAEKAAEMAAEQAAEAQSVAQMAAAERAAKAEEAAELAAAEQAARTEAAAATAAAERAAKAAKATAIAAAEQAATVAEEEAESAAKAPAPAIAEPSASSPPPVGTEPPALAPAPSPPAEKQPVQVTRAPARLPEPAASADIEPPAVQIDEASTQSPVEGVSALPTAPAGMARDTASDEPTPLPQPAPTVAQPAPEPAGPVDPGPPPVPAPERRGGTLRSATDGACPDCQGGEWAVVSSAAAAAGAPSSCTTEQQAKVRRALRQLSTSIHLELEAWAGSVGDGSRHDGLSIASDSTAASVRSAMAGSDGDGGCRAVAVVLPRGARFVGFQYAASDRDGGGDCLPDADCSIGQARWLGRPEVIRGSSAIVVFGFFENHLRERERRGDLTVYFRPPGPTWSPPPGP